MKQFNPNIKQENLKIRHNHSFMMKDMHKKHLKKGQMSIFIIVGLLIIIIIGLFIIFSGLTMKELGAEKEGVQSSNIASVKTVIDSCLKQIVNDGIILVGERGGYYQFNPITPAADGSGVENFQLKAYYFYEDKALMPTLKKIQNQLEAYIEERLPICISFSGLSKQFEIEKGLINAKSRINMDNVWINVDYPLTFLTVDKAFTLKEFNYNIKVRLGMIYKFWEAYINEWQIDDPQTIILSELNKFAEEEGIFYYIVEEDNPNIIFTIVDEKVKVNNEPYKFVIVNKYDWETIT